MSGVMDPDPPTPYPLPPEPLPMDRASMLAALRARVARLERAGAATALARAGAGVVNLSESLDAHLGGGLARAGLHEIIAGDPGAAAGFCAIALGRTAGPVLWIAPEPEAWPPGLARYGLSPAELVLVRAPHPTDGLWAMEEALRCPAIAGALLDLSEIDLTAARRLQLAAEAGGALGLLLRPDTDNPGPSAALTRWKISTLPGDSSSPHHLGDPRWHIELLRGRGTAPRAWSATWRTTTDQLETEPTPLPTRRRA